MWKLFKKSGDRLLEKDLSGLSDSLAGLGREEYLSDSQRSGLKASLMGRLSSGQESLPVSLQSLVDGVEEVSAPAYLASGQRNLLYRILMEKIQSRARFGFSMFANSRNWRAGLASALVFVLVLGLFVASPLELRVTRASKWTFLEDVQGEVYVNRDGRIMAVDKNFSLQEGDLVFTKLNSFVAIRYLDDSVTRLGENTSLEIKKLYVMPDDAVQTQVELSLLAGRVWASVYNLVGNQSSFMIETENVRTDVDSRAVFALTTSNDSTELMVFDNVVDLSKKSAQVTYIQPVVAGFTAEVSSSPFLVKGKDRGIVVEKSDTAQDQWVLTNLAMDKQHQENLKEENQKFVESAVASDNSLGLLADFKDGTKAIFDNGEVEKARQRFLDVHLGFIKAQEFLNESDEDILIRRQATPLLLQYKTGIREITASYDLLKKADSGQTDRLMQLIREEVGLQKKALSLVLPGEKLYSAKEAVMEASSNFIANSADRASYLLERAQNRLLEMQNLISKNYLKEAEAVFRNYLQGLDELVKEVENSQVAEIEGSLFELLNEQIKQFKVLTAIESELKSKGDQRFSAMVNKVKMDSLQKLIVIVKYYRKNGIPLEMVMELRNTGQEFFENSREKKQLLADLDKILADYPEYVQQKEQEEILTDNIDTGSKIIVDFQASQDLGGCLSECAQK